MKRFLLAFAFIFLATFSFAQLDSTVFKNVVELPMNNALYAELVQPDTSQINLLIFDELGYVRRVPARAVIYDVVATPNGDTYNLAPYRVEYFNSQGQAIRPENIFRQ